MSESLSPRLRSVVQRFEKESKLVESADIAAAGVYHTMAATVLRSETLARAENSVPKGEGDTPRTEARAECYRTAARR